MPGKRRPRKDSFFLPAQARFPPRHVRGDLKPKAFQGLGLEVKWLLKDPKSSRDGEGPAVSRAGGSAIPGLSTKGAGG